MKKFFLIFIDILLLTEVIFAMQFYTIGMLDVDRKMLSAVGKGDLEKIQSLFKDNAADIDIDLTNNQGVGLLHIAAMKGHLEVCKFLVGKGLKINSSTYCSYWTPLCCALVHRHANVVQWLIETDPCIVKSFFKAFDEEGGQELLDFAAQLNSEHVKDLIYKAYASQKKCCFRSCIIS